MHNSSECGKSEQIFDASKWSSKKQLIIKAAKSNTMISLVRINTKSHSAKGDITKLKQRHSKNNNKKYKNKNT